MRGYVIVLLTGPQGAGKTTVGRLLAASFERGVHVEGDVFRRFVVAGRSDMSERPSPDALAQLRLRYELAVHATERYAQAGFDVVLEDVVAGPLLAEVLTLFAEPPRVVVLLPSRDAAAARAPERHLEWVYRLFAEQTLRVGDWIDTSHLTAEETATAILQG